MLSARIPHRLALAVWASAILTVACFHRAPIGGTTASSITAVVVVDNAIYPSLEVYMLRASPVRDGVNARRLGTVMAHTAETFTITKSEALDGAPYYFAAHRVGSGSPYSYEYSWGEGTVHPGERYDVHIGDGGRMMVTHSEPPDSTR
jgi:hypothetical protein